MIWENIMKLSDCFIRFAKTMKTYIKYIITLFVLLFAVIIVQSQVRFNVPEVSQISGNKNIEPILSQFTATGDPVIKIHY